jgi:hypothetical protein
MKQPTQTGFERHGVIRRVLFFRKIRYRDLAKKLHRFEATAMLMFVVLRLFDA